MTYKAHSSEKHKKTYMCWWWCETNYINHILLWDSLIQLLQKTLQQCQLEQNIHIPHDPAIPLLDLHPTKDIHNNVHRSTICNSPKLETNQMLTNMRKKSTVVYSYHGEWKQHIKTTATCDTMRNLRNRISNKSRTWKSRNYLIPFI